MPLVRWEPFGEISAFRRQMDRLMDSFFGRESVALPEGRWLPPMDMSETPDEILIKAELPGVDKEDISLNISGDNLIIKGEKKEEKQEKDKHFHRTERFAGSFERVIGLPVAVDAEKIKAEYKNGVLEVHMPKKAEVKPKAIPISLK